MKIGLDPRFTLFICAVRLLELAVALRHGWNGSDEEQGGLGRRRRSMRLLLMA
jgi:hypothetical protein